MSRVLATDMHTHLAPRPSEGEHTVHGVDVDGGKYLLDGRPVGPAALYEPDALAQHLRDNELERAVVSIPPPLYRQGIPGRECARWVVAVNDGLAEAVSGYQQLLPLAYLPLDHPEIAHAEYQRRRSEHRWAGYVGSAGGESAPLDDPSLDPLWTSMSADGALCMLHPGASPDARLRRHYLANLLGNPVETTVAAAELVFGGVLHRHSGVSFLLVHCGGAVPAVAGRWQRGLDTDRPGVAALELGPREAVRRFWIDTLAHDPGMVDLAARVIGEDKIVLGSDWPFPMGMADVRASIAHLGTDTRERIERDNPTRLLGTQPDIPETSIRSTR